MSITRIYKKYKIPHSLRLHQLRVASISNYLIDKLSELDLRNEVVTACLLHDMGNIIKFDLNFDPSLLEPEGIEYWTEVQDEFCRNYGSDEHVATSEIAKEIGVSEVVLNLINSVGFGNVLKNIENDKFENMFVCYCDQRVSPNGVVTIKNRISESQKRFAANKGKSIRRTKEEVDFVKRTEAGLLEIEKKISERVGFDVGSIVDRDITPYVVRLRDYRI